MVEKKRRSRRTAAIRRRPFVRPDIVEMLSEERMEEILHVEFVLDIEGRSIFATEAQLPRHCMKALADRFR